MRRNKEWNRRKKGVAGIIAATILFALTNLISKPLIASYSTTAGSTYYIKAAGQFGNSVLYIQRRQC